MVDNRNNNNNNNDVQKQQQQLKRNDKAPYGTTLLARDTPENRKTWGVDNLGYRAVAASVCPTPDTCPHYDYTEDAINNAASLQTTRPIHLLIASFRDKLCARTLHNAFTRAQYPNRIFVRIIDQTLPDSNLEDDEGCWERYCSTYNTDCAERASQVRVVHVHAAESKGPTDARSKLSAMIFWDYLHRDNNNNNNSSNNDRDFVPVQLQDFCLQTDSHMDFSNGYDTDLILMFHRTRNDYAVLSTYVADIAQNNQDVRVVPNLCMVTFTKTIRNWGTKECRNLVQPKLTNAMWGAGLSFHRCHAEINVPVDPYLDNVFDGEEGSRGIRFFTHGYDVYTPDRVLVTHDYHTHQSNPVVHTWGNKKKLVKANNNNDDSTTTTTEPMKFIQSIQAARSQFSILGTARVNALLGIGPEQQLQEEEVQRIRHSRFGLGNKRTLQQAMEFTGIDLRNRRMVHNKCGNLVWVPYEASPNYGIDETLARIPVEKNVFTTMTQTTMRQRMQLPSSPPPPPDWTVSTQNKQPSDHVLVLGIAVVLLVILAVTSRTTWWKRQKMARHTN